MSDWKMPEPLELRVLRFQGKLTPLREKESEMSDTKGERLPREVTEKPSSGRELTVETLRRAVDSIPLSPAFDHLRRGGGVEKMSKFTATVLSWTTEPDGRGLNLRLASKLKPEFEVSYRGSLEDVQSLRAWLSRNTQGTEGVSTVEVGMDAFRDLLCSVALSDSDDRWDPYPKEGSEPDPASNLRTLRGVLIERLRLVWDSDESENLLFVFLTSTKGDEREETLQIHRPSLEDLRELVDRLWGLRNESLNLEVETEPGESGPWVVALRRLNSEDLLA